jgi:hypothetical protein
LYDSCGIFAHLAIYELRFVHIEHDALQRQLEIRRSILEEKMEQIVVGESLIVDNEVDFL